MHRLVERAAIALARRLDRDAIPFTDEPTNTGVRLRLVPSIADDETFGRE